MSLSEQSFSALVSEVETDPLIQKVYQCAGNKTPVVRV